MTLSSIFYFQAEDGIRDHCVTGVQTCALPISLYPDMGRGGAPMQKILCLAAAATLGCGRVAMADESTAAIRDFGLLGDRKSRRLNSSHTVKSYAVFFLKKKTFVYYIN